MTTRKCTTYFRVVSAFVAMTRALFLIALFFFFIATCYGVLMRCAFVTELPWMHFRYWVHGHSHVAMLGWLYLGLYALLIKVFLPVEKRNQRFYAWNAGFTVLTVIGMSIAFPMQGYGLWSILFSSLHGLLSYAFVYRFHKDLSGKGLEQTFVRMSLFFMVLSTLALWAFPVIIKMGLQGKAIYYMAVQFYLHFQFNGWFLFACLALFFQWLRSRGIPWDPRLGKWFLWLLTISCLLTYALAIAWSHPSLSVFMVNSIGVILQLAALVVFLIGIYNVRTELNSLVSNWPQRLLGLALLSFVAKILVQSAVVIPYVATISFTIRNFVIGFIHLILLGVVTFFLLVIANKENLLVIKNLPSRMGIFLLALGFITTEVWLFIQGLRFWMVKGFLPSYYEILFIFSCLFPLGVLLLLIGQMRRQEMLINHGQA